VTAPITQTERAALIAIRDAGGSAVLSRGSEVRAIGAGERLPFAPSTLLRLLGDGRLRFAEPRRLELTPSARLEIAGEPR
jgi:hypothetical protein